MSNDNRVSAVLTAQDVTDILNSVAAISAKLPFLINLSPQERRELPKMGDKSIGFDDKCRTYMSSHPEFIPGFVNIDEVNKDRELRVQMMRFYAALIALTDQVDDTLSVVSSEAWMADLAYYQAVREAAKRGMAGAETIYADLQQRFPGAPSGPRKVAAPAAEASAG
jgi:hypothetical protein